MDNTPNVTFIEYQEPVSSLVSKFLTKEDFGIASTSLGVAVPALSKVNEHGISVLIGAKPNRRFFGLIKVRREIIGTIWFFNKLNDKSWAFEIYNPDNIQPADQLANKLALVFDVKITIIQKDIKAKFESFSGDYRL